MVDAAENSRSDSTYSSAFLKSGEKGSGVGGAMVGFSVETVLDTLRNLNGKWLRIGRGRKSMAF